VCIYIYQQTIYLEIHDLIVYSLYLFTLYTIPIKYYFFMRIQLCIVRRSFLSIPLFIRVYFDRLIIDRNTLISCKQDNLLCNTV